MAKPNLVVFEMVPESSVMISVPDEVATTEELTLAQGQYLNTTTITPEQERIVGRVNELGTVLEGPADASGYGMVFTMGFIL